jgi:ABC-2 type transport system ATP-binding protein
MTKLEVSTMIELYDICKTFKVSRRNAGFGEALKAMFHKEYDYIKALDDVSFRVNEGEMVGYIGPNGAGKSSTIKVMCGILSPESGSCLINGRTPWKDRIKHVKDIGVVFGQRSQLWWDVPVVDSFELLRDIYKVDYKRYKQTLDKLVTLLNIETIIRTPARQLSLGQRMRCEIAASLLHSPKILFLDEPTIGLDAVSKIAVRDFITKINKEEKTTVILTTHDMQDIEALTQRIILIGKGKILLDGDLNSLKKQYTEQKKITIEYIGELPFLSDGLTMIVGMHGRAVISLDTNVISVSDAIAELSKTIEVIDISVAGSSAEEMVVSLYKEYKI